MRASIMRPSHFGQRGRSIGSSDGSERVKASGMGCAAESGGSTTLSVAAGSRRTGADTRTVLQTNGGVCSKVYTRRICILTESVGPWAVPNPRALPAAARAAVIPRDVQQIMEGKAQGRARHDLASW
jgi:hypothetical protein